MLLGELRAGRVIPMIGRQANEVDDLRAVAVAWRSALDQVPADDGAKERIADEALLGFEMHIRMFAEIDAVVRQARERLSAARTDVAAAGSVLDGARAAGHPLLPAPPGDVRGPAARHHGWQLCKRCHHSRTGRGNRCSAYGTCSTDACYVPRR